MLVERARQARSRIEELQRLKHMQQVIDRYQTRVDNLAGPAVMLTALEELLAEFRTRGLPIDLQERSNKALSLRSHVQELASRFEDDPSSILEANNELRYAFWQPLQSMPGEVKEVVVRAWEHYLNSLFPVMQAALLDTLERVPGLEDQVAEIRRLQRQATSCRQRLPQSAGDFAQAERLAEQLRAAWKNLRGEGIPEEVLTFLRAASDRGASLGQFTSQVRDWLQARGIQGSVRIILGSTTTRTRF